MNAEPNIKTVLLADNSYENLALLGKRLKAEGFLVLTAIDGKQAIGIAQNKIPHIIVVQKNLPLVDGFVLEKIIRSNQQTSRIQVIVLSDEYDNDGFSNGSSNILLNHTNIEVLVGKIRSLVFDTPVINTSKQLHEKRILIVEDNELNQSYISSIVSDLGFKYDIADDGEKALDFFLSKEYDLVLMDVNIPLINGIELTQIIRSKHNRFVSIVAITGHSEKEFIDKCLNAGMTAFLTKPIQAQILKRTILNEISRNVNSKDTSFELNSEEGLARKKYDYSPAINLSNGDKQLFEKWLSRFLDLVKTAIDFIDVSMSTGNFSKRNKIFHELINYSGYFGVDELRLYIKELQSIQKFTTDNTRLENFFRKIKKELEEIEIFFRDLS